MASVTKFFICGNCGFTNKPRPYPQLDALVCEQCGVKGHANSIDYVPGVARA